MRGLLVVALLAWAGAGAGGGAAAQDTLRPRVLEPVVVTAERASGSLSTSVAAVTRLSAAELARMPHATLADLLRRAPGFGVVDFDGLGFDPQLMVRGFYGGGEAEYVVVLVDGKPANQLQNGVVAWDALPPLAAIEAIEIVRGGVSSLYGDAAIGGVINVLTRSAERNGGGGPIRWDASGGSFGSWRAEAAVPGRAAWKQAALSGGLDRTGGFREHAERTAGRARASVPLVQGSGRELALSAWAHWRDYEEPGPLLESLLAAQRNGSDPLFRFDRSTDQSYAAALEGRQRTGSSGRMQLSGTLGGELRRVDAIRTLALAPGFGDTKERLAATDRASLSVQVERTGLLVPERDRLVMGLEGSRGTLDSKYYRYAAGTRSQYGTEQGQRGDLDTRASSARAGGAVYAEYTRRAGKALRLSLGGRFDELHDSFEPKVPSGGSRQAANHSAFSPKAGINFEAFSLPSSSANLYLVVSRSFKAPTLDQLYDQRNIPVPFPPFEIRTSNPELKPQHGTSVESGAYQSAQLRQDLRLDLSFSWYRMDMRDELDFDLASFRYVNIGESRHAGVEVGLQLEGSRVSGFSNYTLQDARSRGFGSTGLRLKAIPRHTLSGGLSVQPLPRRELLRASLNLTRLAGMFLDDANTRVLPSYTRVDGVVELRLRGIGVLVEGRNLFGAKYSSSGFLDPAGTGEANWYPGAGRVVQIGVRGGW